MRFCLKCSDPALLQIFESYLHSQTPHLPMLGYIGRSALGIYWFKKKKNVIHKDIWKTAKSIYTHIFCLPLTEVGGKIHIYCENSCETSLGEMKAIKIPLMSASLTRALDGNLGVLGPVLGSVLTGSVT